MEKRLLVDREEGQELEQARPWTRLWARYFDLILHSLAISVIWILIDVESYDRIPNSLFAMLMLAVWMFLEWGYMTALGTTPGKKISKIRVRTTEGFVPARDIQLRRAVLVWFRGMGIGAGIIGTITNIVAYGNLKKDNITTWDRDLGLVVTHGELGWIRRLICPALVVAIAAFGVVFTFVG